MKVVHIVSFKNFPNCFASFLRTKYKLKQEMIAYLSAPSIVFISSAMKCTVSELSISSETRTHNLQIRSFHHTDPNTKEYSWSKLRLFSDSKIREELSKCQLLCANCHRLVHSNC